GGEQPAHRVRGRAVRQVVERRERPEPAADRGGPAPQRGDRPAVDLVVLVVVALAVDERREPIGALRLHQRDDAHVEAGADLAHQPPRVVLRAAERGRVAKADELESPRHAASPRAWRYAATVFSAHAAHVYSAARRRPEAIRRPRTSGLVSTSSSAAANASSSRGSTSRAASPSTSGRHGAFDATTGVPAAIASRGGNPKPS